MFLAEVFHSTPVGRTEVLPNYLFGDVSTYILPVVARLFGLEFLLLWLEDLRKDLLFLFGRVIRKYERSLSISWRANQLSENRVIRFLSRQPIDCLQVEFLRLF